jgi:phage-related protein
MSWWDAGLLKFRGVSLEQTAPVGLIDVTVSSPSISANYASLPKRDSWMYYDSTVGGRTVVVRFDLPSATKAQRTAMLALINMWASGDELGELILPQDSSGYLMSVCTGFPAAGALNQYEDLSLTFLCPDPFFRALGAPVQGALPGTVTLGTKWQPDIVIEQTGASLNNASWSCNGGSIALHGSVSGAVIIDWQKMSVRVGSSLRNDLLSMSSKFWRLKDGTNPITCSGGAGGVIKMYTKWI